jgi:hypothetical protein
VMATVAVAPEDVTALALASAKGDQLRFWIDKANEGAGRRVLVKTGKVDELRHRLAAYYRLDLSVLPRVVAKAGPLTLDEDIQQRQWNYLRTLGDEWAMTTAAGRQFLLCEPSGEFLFYCFYLVELNRFHSVSLIGLHFRRGDRRRICA